MYICNCNGINEKSVITAIENGAQSPSEIYIANGCRMQCGKCMCEMKELIANKSFNEYKIAS